MLRQQFKYNKKEQITIKTNISKIISCNVIACRRGREDGRSSTSSLPPTILTYEAVQEIDLEFTRPVIVLGPLKDRVNDDLMREVGDILALWLYKLVTLHEMDGCCLDY